MVPLAETLKMTSAPRVTDWLAGLVRIVGAIGVRLTTSEARRLVAAPPELVTATLYDPESFVWTLMSPRALEVAPETLPPSVSGRPFRRHSKKSGGVPEAETLRVTFVPTRTLTSPGCAVMEGGVTMRLSAATVLVAAPN